MYGCGESLDAPCPCRWSASHCVDGACLIFFGRNIRQYSPRRILLKRRAAADEPAGSRYMTVRLAP
jgi:hypothetical protein